MNHIKNFRVYHKKALNFSVFIYKPNYKEIYCRNKSVRFYNIPLFSISGMVAEYNFF